MSPSRPAIGVTTEAASRYAVKIQATPAGRGVQVLLELGERGDDERLQQRVRGAAQREDAEHQPVPAGGPFDRP